MTEIYYSHYGEPPVGFTVESISPSYLNLRVVFNKGAVRNSALTDPSTYTIITSIPSAAFSVGVVTVIPEPDVTYPTYVDLILTDCTNGADYTFKVSGNDLLESEDSTPSEPEFMIANTTIIEYVGVSELPVVLSVIPLSLSSIKVIFSKYMMQNTDLYLAANYVWTGGVRTLKVDKDTNSSVVLTTTEMVASQIYDLTVG